MDFNEEFEQAYLVKKDNTLESLEILNNFCSKWDGKASSEHISMLMRLYYDEVDNSEQNVFVDEVISSIIEKNPQESIESIVRNVEILFSEDASNSVINLVRLIIYNPNNYGEIFARILAKSKPKIRDVFIEKLIEKSEYIPEQPMLEFIPRKAKETLEMYYDIENNK